MSPEKGNMNFCTVINVTPLKLENYLRESFLIRFTVWCISSCPFACLIRAELFPDSKAQVQQNPFSSTADIKITLGFLVNALLSQNPFETTAAPFTSLYHK